MTDTTPRPGPPRPGPPPGQQPTQSVDLGDLVPDQERLEEMSVREHVAVYEDLQRVLAERLDDAGR